NQWLMQMREIREHIRTPAAGAVANPAQVANADQVNRSGETSFGEMLKQAVDSVNEAQQKANELQRAFEMGDPQVDITQVMIQMQKASVSFESMSQVRNRLVSAYKDIMNMPI